MDRGARATVPGGRAAVPRGGPRRAHRAGAGAAPRAAASCTGRPLGRRGGGPPLVARRGRLDDGRLLAGVRRRPAAAARHDRAPRPAGRAVPAGDPVQLAARDHHRPLRRRRGVVAVLVRDRRVATRRDHQAPAGDVRGGRGRARQPAASVDPARRRRLGRGRGRGEADGLARRLLLGRPADSPLPGSAPGDSTDAGCGRTWRSWTCGSRRAWTRWRCGRPVADLRAAPSPRAPPPRR